MKRILKIWFIGSVVVVVVGVVGVALLIRRLAGDDRQDFVYDGQERTFLLHVPDDLPEDAPLVIALHGYTDRAEFIRGYSDMDEQADEHGFVVAYAQGSKDGLGITFWNANLDLGAEPDDVGFLTDLVEHLEDRYDLDPDRTYVYGLSNGGFMSYSLACRAPGVFEAIAVVVGTMSGEDWETCDPATPTPVLHIHGTSDRIVPFDGGLTTFGGWGGAPAVPEVVEWWAERNRTTDLEVEEVGDTTIRRYTGGVGGNEVWFHEIDDFGHRWPGGRTGTDATEVIVDFFGLDERRPA